MDRDFQEYERGRAAACGVIGETSPRSIANIGNAPEPNRPLSGIQVAADRVDTLCNRLNGIVTRISGGRGEEPRKLASDVVEPMVSYLTALERLHDNLGRLDALANELASLA